MYQGIGMGRCLIVLLVLAKLFSMTFNGFWWYVTVQKSIIKTTGKTWNDKCITDHLIKCFPDYPTGMKVDAV